MSLEPVSLAGISATKLDVPRPSARPPVFSGRECKDMLQALCAISIRITGIFSLIFFFFWYSGGSGRLVLHSVFLFFISFIMGGGGSSPMCTPPLHAPIAAASFTGCPSVVRVGETETHEGIWHVLFHCSYSTTPRQTILYSSLLSWLVNNSQETHLALFCFMCAPCLPALCMCKKIFYFSFECNVFNKWTVSDIWVKFFPYVLWFNIQYSLNVPLK